MGLRTVFFGTSEFAQTVLRGLLESPHEVVGVVCAPDRPAGRGRKVHPGPVSAFARSRALALFQPESLRDPATTARLRELDADIFAVASYGLIFPEEILEVPPLGAVNAHASLLPKLRGAAPVERAILAGLDVTGVAVQRIVRRVDAGDVLAVRTTPIGPRETAGELRARLAEIAAGVLPVVLGAIESGQAEALPQDEAEATSAPPLRPGDRAIRWGEPAAATDRRVRALSPRPGAFALLPGDLGSKRLKILAAELEPAPPAAASGRKGAPGEVLVASDREGLLVAAGPDGSEALRPVTLQPEGKRPMDAAAFVRGHRMLPGMRLADGA